MKPRVRPLSRDEIDPTLLELAAYRRSQQPEPFNIYRTLAYHPAMVRHWLEFADALRFEAKLPTRDRELLILRTGVNCHCEYEWGQHVQYAKNGGVSEEELHALLEPVEMYRWPENERLLLLAADQLHTTSEIDDEVWAGLTTFYGEDELIEAVMLVGQYHLVSYVLNGFRVERDEGLAAFPSAQ